MMVGGGPEDGKWNQGRGRRGGGRRVERKKRVIFCLFWPRHVTGYWMGSITVLILWLVGGRGVGFVPLSRVPFLDQPCKYATGLILV